MELSKERIEQAIAGTPDGNKTFFNIDDFPWVGAIESQWQLIRGELDRVLAAIELLPGFEEIQVEQRELSTDRRWKIFPLYAYGHALEANQRRCPHTTAAIQHIPGLQAAMFSILQAGKELPPHCGPYKGVLRYHLGLKVPQPEDRCGICVGGDTAHWAEGRSLIFDDAHLHHAWNRSDEDRVVLFVDFTRPLVSPLKEVNEQFIAAVGKSGFIEGAVEWWGEWEAVYGERVDGFLGV